MAIEIRGLTKAYEGKVVLDGFSCSLAEGATTCVMGPSGCGKTTLMHILLGLIPPDSGDIGPFATMRLSAVFQENRLCENISAISNVRLVTGAALSRAEILCALEELGLADSAGQPVRELSGGMKRRVAIARALLAEYDALLLDEPFRGLDAETRDATLAYVKAKSAGKTTLMITHDPKEAEAMGGDILLLG